MRHNNFELFPGLSSFLKENCLSKSLDELYEIAKQKYYYDRDKSLFSNYVSKTKYKLKKLNKTPLNSDMIISLLRKNKIMDISHICYTLKCSTRELHEILYKAIDEGYQLQTKNGKIIYNIDRVGFNSEKVSQLEEKEICFGVASDLHFGSKHVQISALNDFCDICKKKGVKHIFSPGDILAGNNVYKGQIYDVYAIGSDEQLASAEINIPKGFDWYIMGGNHDYSFVRSSGQNPLIVLANKRNDIHYCGFDEVDVPILNGVDLKMWHPSGGIPYSVSYRLQKGVEQIAFGELQSVVRGVKDKPSIRFVLAGHLHIQMQALFGSIFGCQCGTFEGQTNYLKVKGLVPAIGGYIIKASLGNNGLLKNFEAKFYLFEEIENDWKSYNHSKNLEKNKMKPIFE